MYDEGMRVNVKMDGTQNIVQDSAVLSLIETLDES